MNHWIWEDAIKFKWWTDILITVNHAPSKVNIGMQLYECGRGQSVMSLSNWASRWKTSKDKARNFLTLLEKDGMILHESLGKTTRITVCNYDSYQCDLHDSQTLSHLSNNDSQTLSHTNKKNNKNNNKEISTKVDTKKDELPIIPPSSNPEYEKFKVWIGNNAPYCSSKLKGLLETEYLKLRESYSKTEICETIMQIENRIDLRKKYACLYRTLLNWLKKSKEGVNNGR